jgi:hypothetical protein
MRAPPFLGSTDTKELQFCLGASSQPFSCSTSISFSESSKQFERVDFGSRVLSKVGFMSSHHIYILLWITEAKEDLHFISIESEYFSNYFVLSLATLSQD